jgi:HlyD family type I secretion membrane fusion protein
MTRLAEMELGRIETVKMTPDELSAARAEQARERKQPATGSAPGTGPLAGLSILTEMGLRSRLIFGSVVIGIFFGGFGFWAGLAPLQSGAIAPGSVNVAGQRKTLQHLEGGIVETMMVKEGDTVRAGQVLVRLSNTQALAQLQLLRGQLAASLAATSRLKAERDEKGSIEFDPTVLDLLDGDKAKHDEITEGQQGIFISRRKGFQSQKDLTKQKVRQLTEEINGLNAEIASQNRQLVLIKEELVDLSGLVKKGYARKPKMLELQRQDAALQGARDQNTSRIARAKQAIVEAEISLIEISTRAMNEVVTTLRETQQTIADLRERATASQDILSRIEIRAPVSGRVVNLQIFTDGGVIAPGAAILDIVPEDEMLVVEARVDPVDIDVVHAGLRAEIRLSAFRADEVPVIMGVVENISADSLIDKQTGQAYYTARVVLAKGASLPKDKPLYPGMPAEVLIVTGERTALSYLFEPITRSLNRSLREN